MGKGTAPSGLTALQEANIQLLWDIHADCVTVNGERAISASAFMQLLFCTSGLQKKDCGEQRQEHDEAKASAQALFEAVDKDCDGFLSMLELVSICRFVDERGGPVQLAQIVFRMFDRHGSGQVAQAEIESMSNMLSKVIQSGCSNMTFRDGEDRFCSSLATRNLSQKLRKQTD